MAKLKSITALSSSDTTYESFGRKYAYIILFAQNKRPKGFGHDTHLYEIHKLKLNKNQVGHTSVTCTA
jgi:hypothetical protein